MATPPTYGLTAEGVVAPAQEDIRAWLSASFKEFFGSNGSTGPTTPNGKLIDFATAIAVTYFEGGAGAANSSWFTTAPGVALEKVLSLFAFARIPASSSVVSLVAYGDAGTVIGGGSLVSVETTQDVFITDAGLTIGDLRTYVVRLLSVVEGVAVLIDIDGSSYGYIPLAGDDREDVAVGLAAALVGGGPALSVQVVPFPDPDGNWLIVVEHNGLGDFLLTTSGPVGTIDWYPARRGDATAELQGPRLANAGTVNTIETQVNGWLGVTSTSDADLGANAESDAAYRARHRAQLMGKGSASEEAIRDAVANIEPLGSVTYVKVRSNDTDMVDAEGLPKHSIRVTVQGGDDLLIAQTIMAKKAAGIATYGNNSEMVLDGEGFFKEIFFQRPIEKFIWIEVVLTAGEKFPQVGDPAAAIAAAIALWGDLNISIADDVERFAFGEPINVIAGVKGAAITLGYTLVEGDPQPVMAAADLVMGSTDLALFDTARILVSMAP